MNLQLAIVLAILAVAIIFMGRKFASAVKKKGCACGSECAGCKHAQDSGGACKKILTEIQPKK